MDVSVTPIVERIARVLAGQRLSANARGAYASASQAVDELWQEHVDDAMAVLRTMREPDSVMVREGDPRVWEAMVLAALGEGQG